MKRLVALLLLALAGCTSCAEKILPADLPGIPLEVDPSIALSTPDGGVGHGCAVDGYAITARHVMWDNELKTFQDVAYSQGDIEGIASINGLWSHLDLVTVALSNGAQSLPRGTVAPGETVYWFEYDFRTRENLLRARRRFAVVLRIVAQQIVLSDVPIGGASGTCLINESGQVVGIVNAAWDTDDLKGGGNAVKLPEFSSEP